MSSCPGLSLEDYLMWCFDIVVEGEQEANFSLGMAEAMGNIKPRHRYTKEQLNAIVALYEPYRETVEDRLSDFDDGSQSWRDYAGYSFDFMPDALGAVTIDILEIFRKNSAF